MRSSPRNNRLKQKLMKLSETEGEATRYRTFVKVNTPQILEPKFQMNLKTIRELRQKMNLQIDLEKSSQNVELPLLKTEVSNRINLLLNPVPKVNVIPETKTQAKRRRTMELQAETAKFANNNVNELEKEHGEKMYLIGPNKFIKHYLEHEIFKQEPNLGIFESIARRLNTRYDPISNLENSKRTTSVLEQIPCRSINLYEIREKGVTETNFRDKIYNEPKNKIAFNNYFGLKSNPSSNNLKKPIKNFTKPENFDFESAQKMVEGQHSHISIDDKMKYALMRNKMFVKTLNKTNEALKKFHFLEDKIEY